MDLHFYHCNVCGKTIAVLSMEAIPTVCCGQQMEELSPGTTDGAAEKHVPVITGDADQVRIMVGSIPHPMSEEHSIKWIGLRTAKGFQFKELHPKDMPAADFKLTEGDLPEGAFAYCDLHGLWYSAAGTDL